MKSLILALALLPATLLAQTMLVEGVPIPDHLAKLARTAVAGNSPKDALMRGDNPFAAHPFFNELVKRIDFNKVHEDAAKAMVQVFTQAEIQALVRFQQSPEGQSIGRKMQGYQNLVGGIIQNEMKAALEGYVLSQGTQSGAQSKGVLPLPPTTTKPVVPWTPPTTPPTSPAQPVLQGEGGSSIPPR